MELNSKLSRPSQDDYFMKMAYLAKERSTCFSRKVGCVLVDRKYRVIATGYNGVPRKFPHCNERTCPRINSNSGEDLDKCYAVHAEQNALIACSDPEKIFKIYTTSSPCLTCMVMLLNTGCDEIVYHEAYDQNALELWRKRGRLATYSETNVPTFFGMDFAKGTTQP